MGRQQNVDEARWSGQTGQRHDMATCELGDGMRQTEVDEVEGDAGGGNGNLQGVVVGLDRTNARGARLPWEGMKGHVLTGAELAAGKRTGDNRPCAL